MEWRAEVAYVTVEGVYSISKLGFVYCHIPMSAPSCRELRVHNIKGVKWTNTSMNYSICRLKRWTQ